jgi:hypothetical protein
MLGKMVAENLAQVSKLLACDPTPEISACCRVPGQVLVESADCGSARIGKL